MLSAVCVKCKTYKPVIYIFFNFQNQLNQGVLQKKCVWRYKCINSMLDGHNFSLLAVFIIAIFDYVHIIFWATSVIFIH